MGHGRANTNAAVGKNQRFLGQEQIRRNKREELINKRRGLNFVTEHHEQLLTHDTISTCEAQLDNVAPKIVALLSLSESADTSAVRRHLVRQCLI